MEIIRDKLSWQVNRQDMPSDLKLGLVPTMGALHSGHRALLQRSITECDVTVLSIFVNPTQFNDQQDYENYPNTINDDIQFLDKLAVDYLFLPTEEEMYPEKPAFNFECQQPWLHLFEGVGRPGHFSGVLTVVLKLFNIIQPTIAYFGEKDYQQYRLIESFARDFFLPITVVMCPTVRDQSGLPYSSRYCRLSARGKQLAEQAARHIHHANASNCKAIKQQLCALGVQVEYLDCYESRIFSAVTIENVRLIDNFAVPEPC